MLALLAALVFGAPGTEIALVLDNSGSMINDPRTPGRALSGADPDRRAPLGALLLQGLTQGSEDHLTILTFDGSAPQQTRVLPPGDNLRQLPVADGTYYLGPLQSAREVLESSPREHRLLVFLSDGAPNDYSDPSQGPATLGLDRTPLPFQTLIFGLLPGGGAAGNAEAFMRPLAAKPEDWVAVHDSADLVTHFTRAFARAQGAKPVTGTLRQGDSLPFDVGPWVSEVMVLTASTVRGPRYEAAVTGPNGAVALRAGGDNGCDFQVAMAPRFCADPRLHYQVWRFPHDTGERARYTLSLPSGEHEVAWGIIYRSDLVPRVEVGEVVRVGQEVPVTAWLEQNGAILDDPAFAQQDGFQVTAEIQGDSVTLSRQADGRYTGVWKPSRASGEGPETLTAHFTSAWMDQAATALAKVEAAPKLHLRAQPEALDLGRWSARRGHSERCAALNLSASTGLKENPIELLFEVVQGNAVMYARPLDAGVWEVCARVGPCAGAHTGAAEVLIRGVDPSFHASAVRVPLRYEVVHPGWLYCLWPILAALTLLAILGWIILGYVRPYSFEPGQTLHIAGSERQLGRAAGLVLREQPGGKRGFYRNARVTLTATGELVRRRNGAVLVLVAGPGGAVQVELGSPERRDRRTRQWSPLSEDDRQDGLRNQEIYKIGELYFKLR